MTTGEKLRIYKTITPPKHALHHHKNTETKRRKKKYHILETELERLEFPFLMTSEWFSFLHPQINIPSAILGLLNQPSIGPQTQTFLLWNLWRIASPNIETSRPAVLSEAHVECTSPLPRRDREKCSKKKMGKKWGRKTICERDGFLLHLLFFIFLSSFLLLLFTMWIMKCILSSLVVNEDG